MLSYVYANDSSVAVTADGADKAARWSYDVLQYQGKTFLKADNLKIELAYLEVCDQF